MRGDGSETPREEWTEIDAKLLENPGTRLPVWLERRSIPVIPVGIDLSWIAVMTDPR